MSENERLSARHERAITALLTEQTHRDAAAKCGVSEATLRRWMQDDDFKAAYREARRQVVEHGVSVLQAACADAAKTLRRNLECGHAATEVSAAKAVLDQSVKGVELTDLQERVEQLEALLDAQRAR